MSDLWLYWAGYWGAYHMQLLSVNGLVGVDQTVFRGSHNSVQSVKVNKN